MRARELVLALWFVLGACGRQHDGGPAADGGRGAAGKHAKAGRGGSNSTGGNAGQSTADRGGSNSTGGNAGQSTGPRASSRPTPTEGGFCCPPDDSPGCCMTYGGFSETIEGCNSFDCDGMPMPYEAWTKAEDDHGCPMWVEPVQWDHCCGCENDQPCPIGGMWRIDFDGEPDPCGPSESEVITISSDSDAGTREVTFRGRGPQPSTCSSDGRTEYRTEIITTDSDCIASVTSESRWCTGDVAACEVLKLTLAVRAGYGAAVSGTLTTCACGEGSSTEGKTVELTGRAYRID